MSDGRGRPAEVGVLSLDAYLEFVRPCPRPTARQVDEFVSMVAEAHSWYKHLPPLLPGRVFSFFVDPSAGMERSSKRDGTIRQTEITREHGRIRGHTTSEYRSAFGCLAWQSAGANRATIVKDSLAHRLPPEVAAAGSVELTAVVHPAAAQFWVWSWYPERLVGNWPEQTGGESTLQAILEIAREAAGKLAADLAAHEALPAASRPVQPTGDVGYAHVAAARLETILRPERQRLRGLMKTAIVQMLELVHGPRT